MRIPIRIDTMRDATELSKIASSIDADVYITDDASNLIVSAKSVIGCLYSMEFDKLWLVSSSDLYSKFSKFAK